MHVQKIPSLLFFIGGLLSLLLIGCGANVGKTIKVSDEQLAKYGTLSIEDAIAGLEEHMNAAMKSNMPFFAPDYYRGASEILIEARKSAEKKPKEEIISNIAKADAILDKGQTMMGIVQSRLVNELSMKDQLDKDDVAKVYPKDYDKLISELSSLIEKIELEKADNIDKDKIELIKSMQALDVKAIQYIALHPSDVIFENTQSKDGWKLAPVTLAESRHIYEDAEKRIAQSPHDEELVKQAGADALFAARHALYVSERVLDLQKSIKESIEGIALDEEKRLLGISNALDQKDLRDRPIEKQAEDIAKMAGDLIQGQQTSKLAIGTVSDQSKALETRLKESDDAMNRVNLQLVEKDAQIKDKTAQLSDKDTQISDKDIQLKILKDQVDLLEAQNKSLVEANNAKVKPLKAKQKN